MPNIWYNDKKYNNSNDYNILKDKVKTRYKVLEAVFLDSYHYHGSWFEITWKLTLKDENGEVIEKTMDTWDSDEKLVGKMIEYDGNRFTVINNNLI